MEIKKCECSGTPIFEKIYPTKRYCGFVKCPKCGVETKVYATKQCAVNAWNKGKRECLTPNS